MSYYIDDTGEKRYFIKNYVQKYYRELFMNLLEDAYNEGLISHNEKFIDYIKNKEDISSYYVMTLSILADSFEDVYFDMTDVYLSSKIDYSLGTDLDDIGAIVGCVRPQATRSGVELTFTLQNTYNNTIVLPNILVSTDTGIQYYTTNEIIIPSGVTEVKAYAKSLSSGKDTHVRSNELTNILTELSITGLSVNNEFASSGGREAYNDDEYRELILDWVKNNIRGSKEAYERFFSTFDGVDGYKLIPNWDGISGTLKVVLDPGIPEQLQEAYDGLMGNVCQFTEDIVLFPPTPVGIDVYATCNVDIDMINPYSTTEKEEIKSRIIDAIKLYVDGDNITRTINGETVTYTGLGIGEDFIPYQLGVFMSDFVPELKNVFFDEDKTKITTVSDEEKCFINNINITMDSSIERKTSTSNNSDSEETTSEAELKWLNIV